MLAKFKPGPEYFYKKYCRPLLLALVAHLFSFPLMAQDPDPAPAVLAPGWTELEFESPVPGSYKLPPLGLAGDGAVVDSGGDTFRLHSLMGDKIVVLSFIYSSCSDANGCPLATHVLQRVQNRLLEDSVDQKGVRFISLSFDPGQDTPTVMRQYGSRYIKEGFDWRFMTTADEQNLDPILQSYGQAIVRDPVEEPGMAGNISHILRVFLIDHDKRIRNVYSASFLHADSMISDIETLKMEVLAANQAPRHSLQGPGDYKEGYENYDYQTDALSLQSRKGIETDLLSYLEDPPTGLPPIPEPNDNPITREKVALGKLLFFDRRLSHNNTISCAMCHVPEQGFSSNELTTAVGIEGRSVRRNAPSIYNVAYLDRLFHDGRESSLEQQIWGPLLAHNEMGNPSVGQLMDQIGRIPEYPEMFNRAFDGRSLSMELVGMALASYERVLVSANSPFDRWYYQDQEDSLNDDQKAGFDLFTGKAGCVSCHLVNTDWALFTDQSLHNTGIGYERSMARKPGETRVQIAPGESIVLHADIADQAFQAPPNDLGLYEITENPDDRWKYRTPSLRNVALTAPYMHDGSLSTLEQVIEFYNQGGIQNELLDPLVRPLNLSNQESIQLLAFLQSLTGDNVDALVADAFVTPVGNTDSAH
jgi:cytochrome c peroxidase